MQGWTYTGDFRINRSKRTDDGLMNGVVWWEPKLSEWCWYVSTTKDREYKTLGKGTAKSARLCIELVHAMLNV